MNEAYFIGIYWQSGAPTASECATQLASFLQQLPQHDSIFNEWYQTAASRATAISLPVQADEKVLEDILLKQSHSNTQFGYNLKLWTGNSDRGSATISFRCGCNNEKVTALLNMCLVELPLDSSMVTPILKIKPLINIMKIGIDIWQPDYALVNSNDFLKSFIDMGNSIPKIGRLTYVKTAYNYLPPLSPDFRIEQFCKGLLISTREELSAKNPIHVQTMLTGADLLSKYLSSELNTGSEATR